MFLTRRPLVTQLLILVGGVVVLTILALGGAAIVVAQRVVGTEITQRVIAQSEITSQLLAPPLATHDQAAVATILQAIVREDSLEQAVLFDPAGAVLHVQSAPGFTDEDPAEADVEFALSAVRAGQTVVQDEPDHLDVATPILVANQPVAVLVGHSPVA